MSGQARVGVCCGRPRTLRTPRRGDAEGGKGQLKLKKAMYKQGSRTRADRKTW